MPPTPYLDALLALPSLDDAKVSPDGAWAAWTWLNAGPTTDVYAAPTDGSGAPIKLTDTPENAQLVGWTPDSRAVLVEQDHEGDERVQIFRIDLARPGLMQPLTEPSPNYFLHSVQLHPRPLADLLRECRFRHRQGDRAGLVLSARFGDRPAARAGAPAAERCGQRAAERAGHPYLVHPAGSPARRLPGVAGRHRGAG